MKTSSTETMPAPIRDCGCAPTCCPPSPIAPYAPAYPPDDIRDFVRQRYGSIAESADAAGAGCCGGVESSYAASLGYSSAELAAVPDGANLNLGCGNPLAIASIKPGETIVDLGSGAGFDSFLAARQLAGTGRVIGVDMTASMITKARANARKGGYTNVEFRLGEIEALPIADATVDLIMSNCVINLSPEKHRVFHEAFRVLRSGGRLAIADVVATRPVPQEVRLRLSAIGACVGGASLIDDVRTQLSEAGFTQIEIASKEGSRKVVNQWTEDENAGDFVVSALITAVKP
jgi:arsenite methyltransferase